MILSTLLTIRVDITDAKLIPIIINQILVLRFFILTISTSLTGTN